MHFWYQLLAVVTDNAGNNGTLIRALAASCRDDLPGQFIPATNWIRCFAHILNLAAQEAIKILKEDPSRGNETSLTSGLHSKSKSVEGDFLDGRDLSHEVLKQLSVYERVSTLL